MATEETKNEVPLPVSLTEEQQKFLEQCEIDFTARYTEEDLDFMVVKENPSDKPPIVDPWYNKPRRNFDWADRRGGRRGGGGDNDRSYQHRENQGGYQQHRQQNQGGYQHHRQGDRYYQRHRPY